MHARRYGNYGISHYMWNLSAVSICHYYDQKARKNKGNGTIEYFNGYLAL